MVLCESQRSYLPANRRGAGSNMVLPIAEDLMWFLQSQRSYLMWFLQMHLMWFLQISEELSNVIPANRRVVLRIAEELSNVVPANRRSYLMWFLRIAEELSNVVPANRRGDI